MKLYINFYRDIPRAFKFRDLVRSFLLDVLSFRVKYRNRDLLKTPRVQFVYIHHVFDDEIEAFDKLIFDLKEFYSIISFSEAVNRVYTNNIDRPYLAFSSDDGFKSNLNASKIFLKHNISACFFICTDFIGLNDFGKIKDICKIKFHLPPVEFLNLNDIKYLNSVGHEIGSHTTSHSNLMSLNFEDLKSVISDSFPVLKNIIDNIKHFSFPYGTKSHLPSKAHKIITDSGFVSCISAIRGCHIKEEYKKKDISKIIIKRDLLNENHNINHVLYFMVQNIKNARK